MANKIVAFSGFQGWTEVETTTGFLRVKVDFNFIDKDI
jgi:hypothetical protein